MFPPESTFRMEFKPLFLFIYIAGSIAGATSIISWTVLAPSFSDVETYIVLKTVGHYIVFFAPVYSAACAYALTTYFRYVITIDGIGGKSLLGPVRLARWGDIGQMKPVRIGNLHFVRLVTRDRGLPIWLPLFIRDDEAFGGTILQYAPMDNVARSLVRTVHLAA